MRIIAGSSKGKTLFSPPEATRPTSDRAREGLFSSLESEFGTMSDLAFLDLFTGSGAVGVEALSRGATSVYAVEQHEATANISRKNFELVNNPSGDFSVVNSSVERFLISPGLPKGFTFDIIFMDPPYSLPNSDIEKILQSIYENGLLANRGLIAIERESRSKPFTWPEPFIAEKIRSYGQGSIFYGGLPASVLP
jgi:16S rRNA (guanine966-N2)-methyltransferase